MENFQNIIDVIEHSGGVIGYHPGIIQALADEQGADMATATVAQKAVLGKEGQGMYLAVALLLNSDKNRYGKLIEDLENNYLHGKDNYPKTVTSAYNILTNWKQDVRNIQGPTNDGISFTNVEDGANNEEEPDVTLATDGKKKDFPHITCHCCGKKGHYASACTEERQSSEQLLMAGVDDGEFESPGVSFSFHTDGCIAPLRHTSVTLEISQDGLVSSSWVLLDNCSTVDVFHNGELLDNIRVADSHIDIHCNAGVTSTNLVGDLPGPHRGITFD
eukprot:scaffold173586_cov64-Attheya_sp.AAC.1